ncbi:hypothetical protein [Shinella sp. BYT-45]|uniref:hypothetical protein n=1 Tax=Shinella sp. BYT-45 TaxID=3377377 RepID=UPI00397F8D61
MSRVRNFLITSAAVGLTALPATAQGLEPVPGSITYNGQPRTKLMKAPIGSTFSHNVQDPVTRQNYVEVYRIRPDRSLEIISRRLYGPINN